MALVKGWRLMQKVVEFANGSGLSLPGTRPEKKRVGVCHLAQPSGRSTESNLWLFIPQHTLRLRPSSSMAVPAVLGTVRPTRVREQTRPLGGAHTADPL